MVTQKFLISVTCLLVLTACSSEVVDEPDVAQESQSSGITFQNSSSSIGDEFLFADVPVRGTGEVIDGPIKFSLGLLGFYVNKRLRPSNDWIEEAIEVSATGNKCGQPLTDERIAELRTVFKGDQSIIEYEVYDANIVMGPEVYYITVVPNLMNYKDKAAVNRDFEICAVGGQPIFTLNKDWLVFANIACGGASLNGEMCDAAKEAIEKTLVLR